MKKLNQKGFTLIELLIVIVIIGILAGVVLQILDPAKQQRRAHDGVTKATMEKMALSVGAFNAAYGSYPTSTEIVDEVENESAYTDHTTYAELEFNNPDVSFIYRPSGTPPTAYNIYATALELPSPYTVYSIDHKGVFTRCEGTPDSVTVGSCDPL